MSDSREKLFLHWSDSIQKFDYYVVGFVGASVIYLIKEHRAEEIGLNPSTIELSAIIAFIVSLFAGITRIEKLITVLRVSHDISPREEWLRKFQLRNKNEQFLSESSLKPLSEEELVSKEAQLSESLKKAKEGRVSLTRASGVLYSIRNVALAVGVLLLLAAKVAEPYLAK